MCKTLDLTSSFCHLTSTSEQSPTKVIMNDDFSLMDCIRLSPTISLLMNLQLFWAWSEGAVVSFQSMLRNEVNKKGDTKQPVFTKLWFCSVCWHI